MSHFNGHGEVSEKRYWQEFKDYPVKVLRLLGMFPDSADANAW